LAHVEYGNTITFSPIGLGLPDLDFLDKRCNQLSGGLKGKDGITMKSTMLFSAITDIIEISLHLNIKFHEYIRLSIATM
jgi:hypothetical protein